MRKIATVAAALTLAVLVASPAFAQPGGRGMGMMGSPIFLLMQESVRKELKMTEEQSTKAQDYAREQFGSFRGLRDLSEDERRTKLEEIRKKNDKALAEILKEDQAKRLKEIALQQSGPSAFANPEVTDKLKLTDDQKTKIKDIQQDAGEAMREIFQNAAGDREGAMKEMRKLQKEVLEKIVTELKDDQKAEWKKMTGEPFTGEIRFGRPGGN